MGAVAEADQGLGVVEYGTGVQPVDDPVGTCTSPGGENRPHARVGERRVQVGQAVLVPPGHRTPLVEDVLSQFHP